VSPWEKRQGAASNAEGVAEILSPFQRCRIRGHPFQGLTPLAIHCQPLRGFNGDIRPREERCRPDVSPHEWGWTKKEMQWAILLRRRKRLRFGKGTATPKNKDTRTLYSFLLTSPGSFTTLSAEGGVRPGVHAGLGFRAGRSLSRPFTGVLGGEGQEVRKRT